MKALPVLRWEPYTAMHPMNFGLGVLNVATKRDMNTGRRYFADYHGESPRCPFDGAMIEFGTGMTGGWPPEQIFYSWCPICLDEREW